MLDGTLWTDRISHHTSGNHLANSGSLYISRKGRQRHQRTSRWWEFFLFEKTVIDEGLTPDRNIQRGWNRIRVLMRKQRAEGVCLQWVGTVAMAARRLEMSRFSLPQYEWHWVTSLYNSFNWWRRTNTELIGRLSDKSVLCRNDGSSISLVRSFYLLTEQKPSCGEVTYAH